MAPDPLGLAGAIRARVSEVPGVMGPDPSSKLATYGYGAPVRGVRVNREPSGAASVEVEVLGFLGAPLAEAAHSLRTACQELATGWGWELGRVDVTVTDVVPWPTGDSPASPVDAGAARQVVASYAGDPL